MKKKLFFVDHKTCSTYSYEELIHWLNGEGNIHYKYYHSQSSKDIFKNLIIGLLSNKTTILLDSSFTPNEIDSLIGTDENSKLETPVKLNIQSLNELIDRLKNSKGKIGLFTSGTTGKPKLILHYASKFMNTVQLDKKHVGDIWGLPFNPTHMAGVQVFLQALLNRNSIIELFGATNEAISTLIHEYKITHLSATPTFYRLLDSKGKVFNHVKRITLGGEKSNEIVYKKINEIFPNARITNIYASTEFGTVFISEGEFFSIIPRLVDKVKFIDNVLFIHYSLMGETSETVDEEWYNTEDCVKIVSESPIKFQFLGRVSSVINVGGYNVYPKEIESEILKIEGVELARVYAKKNSIIGNLIVAEVQKNKDVDLSEKEIIDKLKKQLQVHKIPRIIKFVDNISLTHTGKVKQQK